GLVVALAAAAVIELRERLAAARVRDVGDVIEGPVVQALLMAWPGLPLEVGRTTARRAELRVAVAADRLRAVHHRLRLTRPPEPRLDVAGDAGVHGRGIAGVVQVAAHERDRGGLVHADLVRPTRVRAQAEVVGVRVGDRRATPPVAG